MNKRDLILDTMQELFKEGFAGTASVNDIAKKAGIAKGGLYYYFHSKEEVMDALIDREYNEIIENCRQLIEKSQLNAVENFALLLHTYTNSYVDPSLDEYLYLPQNAAIHQKSLSKILISLSNIIKGIIEQGIKEGTFSCEYPEEYAQIFLSVFTFLFDPGIFRWTETQMFSKLKAFAAIMEKGLSVPTGTFIFLYQSYPLYK